MIYCTFSDGINYTVCDSCHENAECVYNGDDHQLECQCNESSSGDGSECSTDNGMIDSTIRDNDLVDENSSEASLYCTSVVIFMVLFVSFL